MRPGRVPRSCRRRPATRRCATIASAFPTSTSATVTWSYTSRVAAIATNADPTPPAPMTSTRTAATLLARTCGARKILAVQPDDRPTQSEHRVLWADQVAQRPYPACARRASRDPVRSDVGRRCRDHRRRLHGLVDCAFAPDARPHDAGCSWSTPTTSDSARPGGTADGVSASWPVVCTLRSDSPSVRATTPRRPVAEASR